MQFVTQTRTITTILIGLATGILGFDGPMGILFYALADLCVSLLMLLRFGCKAQPYFKDLQSIY